VAVWGGDRSDGAADGWGYPTGGQEFEATRHPRGGGSGHRRHRRQAGGDARPGGPLAGDSASAATAGVTGTSSANDGNGVFGNNTASLGFGNGVQGNNASQGDGATGVYGHATATSGKTFGVYGETNSGTTNASGVYGVAHIGTTNGVQGRTPAP
jgi:hypothetical protein